MSENIDGDEKSFTFKSDNEATVSEYYGDNDIIYSLIYTNIIDHI